MKYYSFVDDYCEIISLDLYVPQTLHTWWASFNSPHCSHFTIPGTVNLKWVRRLSRRVLDVLLWGTAMFIHLLISINSSLTRRMLHHYSKKSFSTASRGSTTFVSQLQVLTFKSVPHLWHSPLQEALHNGIWGRCIRKASSTNGIRSTMSSST